MSPLSCVRIGIAIKPAAVGDPVCETRDSRARVAQKTAHDTTFRALVHEHGAYLWRALRSLGVAEAELSDVCQEVFLVVHRQLPGFEGRSSLRTWIYGIALRVAADHRGKAYRRREVLPASLPEQVSEPEQGRALERRDAWALIETLLAQLDAERRQVFVLYEIEQLSMPQVAALLGWPQSTAYARLASARAQVQQGLAALRAQNEEP